MNLNSNSFPLGRFLIRPHLQTWFKSIVLIGLISHTALAVTVPFVEHFSADAANWADSSGLALVNHFASGGPDGDAYVATTFSPAGRGGDSVVLFRGQDEFNSSGGAFVGNWITESVERFSAYVRHTAPLPLNFFTRFSGPANFPGASAVRFAPVLPNTWTLIEFDIKPSNPAFVTFEGTSFNTVFSNIGHVQVGVDVPETLDAITTPFTFDFDQPSVTAIPEPASATLVIGTLAACALFGRARIR